MGSTLIVFYSYTGNSRGVAQLLAAQRGWPVGEVVEQRPRAGTLGFLECLADSLLARRPAVKYEGPDPANFATVVLIAPIWAGRLAGPMRSFIADKRESIRRAAVLMTMGARGASNAVAEIARLLSKDPVLTEVVTAREAQDGSCAAAVEAFGRALQAPADAQPVRPATWSPEAG